MTAPTPHILDMGAANYADVLDRSRQVPVLVDFWAEWCGPCKALGPLLEKVVGEYDGKLLLAKVDIDVEGQLAGMFGIQSVPTVILVVDGRPVDGFAGALPEAELRRFLEAHLGSASGADPLALAREALEAGRAAEALELLEGIYSERPDDDQVKLLLARAAAEAGDRARSSAVLDALGPVAADGAEARALRAQLALAAADTGDLAEIEARVAADPSDLGARIELGRAQVAAGMTEQGLETILATLEVDRDHDSQAARRAMVEILDALGPDSDLAHDFRRRLQVAMYV